MIQSSLHNGTTGKRGREEEWIENREGERVGVKEGKERKRERERKGGRKKTFHCS